MRPKIDLLAFVNDGVFGPFSCNTEPEKVIALLGQPDPWVTYPGVLSYGNVSFRVVDGSSRVRLLVSFAFQHPEMFRIPYQTWRSSWEPSWHKMLYDWPDSRFEFSLGPFTSGVTLDTVFNDLLSEIAELECISPNRRSRVFEMPSGVSLVFSNVDMDGTYTLRCFQTTTIWGLGNV